MVYTARRARKAQVFQCLTNRSPVKAWLGTQNVELTADFHVFHWVSNVSSGLPVGTVNCNRLLSKSKADELKNIAKEVDQPGSPASESPICRNDVTFVG